MNNRVALIMGATGGIGQCIARSLSDDGWTLSLGARKPDVLRPIFPDAHLFRFDSRRADEAEWVSQAREHLDRIDAVICAAGAMVPDDVIDIEDDQLDLMLDINVKSPRRLVRAAWPDLVESGRGRVILLASLSGKRVRSAASGSYAVSKHAALALCHGIRHKGWGQGIRATAICPGRVDTAMARSITDTPPEEMTPPEFVASMVRFALNAPANASLAEMTVNCEVEDQY